MVKTTRRRRAEPELMMSKTPSNPTVHPIGSPASWALHFALIGGASGFLAPYLMSQGFLPEAYLTTTGIGGAAVGAALGALLPTLLLRLGTIPLGLLLLIGPAVGAIWGGLTGALGGAQLIASHHMLSVDLAVLSVMLASFAGALQFGWLWLPYTLLRARPTRANAPLWALVGIAMAMPVVGHCVLVDAVFPLFSR